MKALILSHKEDIKQYYIYNIAEDGIPNDYSPEFNFMGLYTPIMNREVYSHEYTNGGISFKTTAEVLRGYTYSASKTEVLRGAEFIEGAVFENAEGETIIAAWAETRVDESEEASAPIQLAGEYFNETTEVMYWDFSITKEAFPIENPLFNLTATPVFIKTTPVEEEEPPSGPGYSPPVTSPTHHDVILANAVPVEFGNLNTFPNPFVDLLTICLLYTSPSPRDATLSRMPSSA